ncbi:MAG: WG repeat-containing protein [Bdellovibrionia bacterium]
MTYLLIFAFGLLSGIGLASFERPVTALQVARLNLRTSVLLDEVTSSPSKRAPTTTVASTPAPEAIEKKSEEKTRSAREVLFERDGKWGIQDEAGNPLSQAIFDEVQDNGPNEPLAAMVNGQWGFLDHEGRWLIPPTFEDYSNFVDGVAAVKLNGKWGYADNKGRMVSEPQFDELWQYDDEDVAMFTVDGKFGYVRRGGHVILPAVADYVRWFRQGVGAVQISGKYGYLNREGEWTIPPRYDKANDFKRDGTAMVVMGGETWYVDREGNPLKRGLWKGE